MCCLKLLTESFLAMKILNILSSIALIFALANAGTATAQKLPEAHQRIAEREIKANISTTGNFVTASLIDVRAHNPFDELRVQMLNAPAVDLSNPVASKMVNYAERFLGTRYVWGATGPNAFDCSGFIGYVYRNFGINLHRTSREQFTQGERVSMNNLRPGDLLFFSSNRSGRGRVGHVAMVVSVDVNAGTCTFIHASTKRGVVYQRFPDNGYYQRNFVGARRILGTSLDQSASTPAANMPN